MGPWLQTAAIAYDAGFDDMRELSALARRVSEASNGPASLSAAASARWHEAASCTESVQRRLRR